MTLIATLLAATLLHLSPAGEKVPLDIVGYGALIDQAMINCKNARGKDIDLGLLWKLAEIESTYNPAPEVRGMVLAAACMESGFNPNAKGDKKFSKSGKKPMAIGILQQWKIYEKMYGTDRTNPVSAAHSWMKHIVKMLPKVKKLCKYKTPEKIWIAEFLISLGIWVEA